MAANVLAYGTGALNIDGCRIGTTDNLNGGAYSNGGKDLTAASSYAMGTKAGEFVQPLGRWPANVVHDGSDEVLAGFPQTGKSTGGRVANISTTSTIYGGGKGLGQDLAAADVRGDPGYGDRGSAARFFYCAKASARDRNEGLPADQPNTHPTVKPTDLMRWLVRLVTPPGGVVLDPFAGSGSTGKAAVAEGCVFVGIEQEVESHGIATARLAHALQAEQEVESHGIATARLAHALQAEAARWGD